MSKIAIVGAGRVGIACARIIDSILVEAVYVIDTDPEALRRYSGQCRLAAGIDQLEQVLTDIDPDVVICSTPFHVNLAVAKICQARGYHYVDFTEDVQVTKAIETLGIIRATFVPQTGLAPGLISYIGLSLFEGLRHPPLSLDLRVGALPQVSFGPGHYAITWSPEGLINEYLNDAERKVNGIVENVSPLCDEETVIVDGRQYEGFTTSGGVGNLDAYAHIPNVEYKTLRHAGHLQFIQKFLSTVGHDFDSAVRLAKSTFTTTRDDVVVLLAHAVDVERNSASRGIHFFPHDELGLTALELTTAGTGVAVVELILRGELSAGVLRPDDIPFSLLRTTKAYELIFSAAR